MSVPFKKAIVVGEIRPLAAMSTFSCESLICGCANIFWINAPCNIDIINTINRRQFREFDFGNEILREIDLKTFVEYRSSLNSR